jgi:hypothetical protein
MTGQQIRLGAFAVNFTLWAIILILAFEVFRP